MYIIHNDKVLTYIDYQPVYKGLNITEFGEGTNDSDSQNSAPCYRRNYIVHFVLEGTGSFYRDGKTFELSKGKAFVITPKNLIHYQAQKGTCWTYCWMSFSGIDCDTLFRQCGFTDETAVFDFDDEDIAPLKRHLALLRENGTSNMPVFALSVGAMCFEVLKNCAAKLRLDEPKKQKISSSVIDTAVAYMLANLHKPMDVTQLCLELGVSRTYFSTLFTATLKQSPYRYLQNLRIQQASELLLSDKNLRVYEVAEMVGFSSTAQFCKTFHKIHGCRPLQFRDRYMKRET